MNEVLERIKQAAQNDGQAAGDAGDSEPVRQAATGVKLPAISVNPRVFNSSVSVPEIKPLSNDRYDRREAHAAQRQLARVALKATQFGVAMQAVRSVNTYVVYAADQGQEDMMDILYSKTRYEGMNEMLSQVIGQSLQQMVAQMLALAEMHYKRQTEEL
jgi:hypothetical protein